VCRLDHALAVGVIERLGGLTGDPDRVLDRELLFQLQAVAERLTLDEGHGEPELARGIATVENRQDVGVLQPGGELDLAEKALGAEGAASSGWSTLRATGRSWRRSCAR
jgi:hypothetical protein